MTGAGSSALIGTTTQVLEHVKPTQDQLSEGSRRLQFPRLPNDYVQRHEDILIAHRVRIARHRIAIHPYRTLK
jgi:hypothetical protein